MAFPTKLFKVLHNAFSFVGLFSLCKVLSQFILRKMKIISGVQTPDSRHQGHPLLGCMSRGSEGRRLEV